LVVLKLKSFKIHIA